MSECTKGELKMNSHCTGLAQIDEITIFAVFPSMCNTPEQLDQRNTRAKELLHRWNAFEKDGLVEELRTACEMGLNAVKGVRDINKLMDGSVENKRRLETHVEQIEAVLAKS